METIEKAVNGINFDKVFTDKDSGKKRYTAKVLVVGKDIRDLVAKHRGVDFVSSLLGVAEYIPETGEWFLTIANFNLKGEPIEAMPGKLLDFHQDFLTAETQDNRLIFPPNFDFAAFAVMKAKVRAEAAERLKIKGATK